MSLPTNPCLESGAVDIDYRTARETLNSSERERGGTTISIIVPTFNERENVGVMVNELSKAMHDVEWEVIFVDDDSPDGTADRVRGIGREQPRVRCVHRIGRRGLSGACIEGMLASSAPYIALMDGDLQHDPAVVRKMLSVLEAGQAEIAIGSRYLEGGGCGDLSRSRRRASDFAALLSRLLLADNLTDPMSNYFALRRELFQEVVRGLSGLSFKILLDILLTARRSVRIREIPYVLGSRHAGESKLDAQVAWDYMMLLLDKTIGQYVPVRFVAFATIGAIGAGAHLVSLVVAYRGVGIGFVISATLATVVSMVLNYSLNNVLTYRDRRRRGLRWLSGLVSFVAVCGIGAAANVGIAAYLFSHETDWFLAAIAGVLASAVWNYSATSFYTWGRRN